MLKFIDDNIFPYNETIILILNYLLVTSHIMYKNYLTQGKYPNSIIYQDINNSTIKIFKIIENLFNKSENSIIIPFFNSIGYDFFIKMGEIPLYICGLTMNNNMGT